MSNWVRAAGVAQVHEKGCHVVQVEGQTLALFAQGERILAIDNRCPHMGFPLDRGTLHDGILTCHWHHARFDLATGGAFDLFADDVPVFPAEVRGEEVWVDLAARRDPRAHHLKRLNDGMEQVLPLVIAKAVIALEDEAAALAAGLELGTRYRRGGWGQGLTMLTCLANLLPFLDAEDRPLALYHGLSAVAFDTAGSPPRFALDPLPGAAPDFETLKRWFRRFVEVRDAEGAERCLATAVRAGADDRQMAELLFTAATDHRYLQVGHVADFTNKALEALDRAGWEIERAEGVLTSLAGTYAGAARMEETNAWRNPVDLVERLHVAFEALPRALEAGDLRRKHVDGKVGLEIWEGQAELAANLLSDDPQLSLDSLIGALEAGATDEQAAGAVAYAASLRIARFHTSNEFGDWDTTLHTFSFANAMHQAVRRAGGARMGYAERAELMRGVLDAAMSVYLDRFLNIPPARLPAGEGERPDPVGELVELTALLDRQQRVNEAGAATARYLGAGGEAGRLLATLGKLLLREDRDFHTIQTVEAAFRQYSLLKGNPAARNVLVAAARYLAAHSPTVRAEGQTFQIARRLHRGERVFEGE